MTSTDPNHETPDDDQTIKLVNTSRPSDATEEVEEADSSYLWNDDWLASKDEQ